MNTQTMRQALHLIAGIALSHLMITPAQAVTPIQNEIEEIWGEENSYFGYSVATDRDYPNDVLVGVPYARQYWDSSDGPGKFVLMHYDDVVRPIIFVMGPSDTEWTQSFGSSVAMDLDAGVIVVGCPECGDLNTGEGGGAVYVFRRDSQYSWHQEAKLTDPDGQAADSFGSSVAMDGNVIVIGKPQANKVFVFTWNGSVGDSSGWRQYPYTLAPFSLDDSGNPIWLSDIGEFGTSVALDGDTILVGAAFTPRREAWLYHVEPVSGPPYSFISLEAKLTASDRSNDSEGFGRSVALDGDTAVIGAPLDWGDDPVQEESYGSVYIFRDNGSGTWEQEAKLYASDFPSDIFQPEFGYSVAVDGDTVVATTPFYPDNYPDEYQSGAVYVFNRSGSNWSETSKLMASDGEFYDYLGRTPNGGVAISGANVFAGSYVHDVTDNYGNTYENAGAVYQFKLNTPPVADAGPDQTVEATANPDSPVTLDGTGSYDDDGDTLTYSWTGTSVSASGATPTVNLGLGEHTLTLEVDDGTYTATDDVVITVQDTTFPEITAPADVTADATGALTPVDIGTAEASDLFLQAVFSDAPDMYPLGTTTVTWTATDTSGNSVTAEQKVTVQDVEAPTWSVPAAVTATATGLDGAVVNYSATPSDNVGVTSSSCEPASGTNFAIGSTTVTCTASDAAGNTGTASFDVTVEVEASADSAELLINVIESMGLNKNVEASLTGPLGQVSRILSDDNPDNDGSVCGKIDDLLATLDEKLSAGQITQEDADAIRTFAEAFASQLGCSA